MAPIYQPQPVQFFCALLGKSPEHLQTALTALQNTFEVHELMDPFPFEGTSYYEDEVGAQPWRHFVSLDGLEDRRRLVEIKSHTNALELELWGGQRLVNLDPGYLTLGQVFLATTKDQRHRVYLDQGIYAELTLYWEAKKWQGFPWTYRDWLQTNYHTRLKVLRDHLHQDLKAQGLHSPLGERMHTNTF